MPRDHFSPVADAYASARPTYPREAVDALLDGSPPVALALDVGCGSGQLSLLLSTRVRRVLACDPSAAQLERAPAHPRVRYVRAAAERLPAGDGSVDLVVAAQAAHWFDLETFYAEVRRVVRPDGLLGLLTYGPPRLPGDLDARLGAFTRERAAPWWPPERQWVESGYRDLPFPFDRLPAPPLTIRRRWSLEQMLAYVHTWSATRQAAAAGIDLAADARAVLTPSWPEAPVEVRWPLTLIRGRVRSTLPANGSGVTPSRGRPPEKGPGPRWRRRGTRPRSRSDSRGPGRAPAAALPATRAAGFGEPTAAPAWPGGGR